jgi:hypothetical protein
MKLCEYNISAVNLLHVLATFVVIFREVLYEGLIIKYIKTDVQI